MELDWSTIGTEIIQIYIYIYICVWVCVCVCVYIQYTHIHFDTHTQTYIYVMCVCLYKKHINIFLFYLVNSKSQTSVKKISVECLNCKFTYKTYILYMLSFVKIANEETSSLVFLLHNIQTDIFIYSIDFSNKNA